MSKRRSLFVALSGVFAAVLGTLWWRQRGVPTTVANPTHTAAEALLVEAVAPQIAVETPAPAIPQWVVLTLRLVSAVFGLLCLVQMQGLLLASRLPFAPLGLFVLGIALLLPLVANHMPPQAATTPIPAAIDTKPPTSNRMRRAFYFAATLFFVFVSLVIAQFGRFSLLLVLVWLLGIIGILSAALTLKIDWRALIQQRQILQSLALDATIMLLMQVLLGLLLRMTFSPLSLMPMQDIDLRIMDMLAEGQTPDYYVETTPFYLSLENAIAGPTRELADMQRFSGMFALTIVPAVYFFARVMAGRWTGLFAAGFAAVGLWTLAIAKSGGVYPALAMCSAVYLGILFVNPSKFQENSAEDIKRTKYVLAGIVLGTGWLIAPDFGLMALLLPIRSLFGFLDERPAWWVQAVERLKRVYRKRRLIVLILVILLIPIIVPFTLLTRWWRAQRRLPHAFVTLLVTAVVVLPFVRLAPTFRWLPVPLISPDFQLLTGIPPLYAVLDALAYGLLAFNLTRDPSPLHGMINRPVFMPLLGALFLMGILAWAWRVYRTRQWREGFLLAVFVVALLPSALNLPLPLTYPDSWRMATALPIAVFIAAYGAMTLARSLQTLLGRVGVGVAIVLFALSLWLIAADARQHYNNIALPTFEQGILLFSQSTH